ncbi:MAG: PIN domain-containing protein [Thaumarchaeota archaeon]|nr:PIN domain-containing protein [Nitrososphaerota archaeon]
MKLYLETSVIGFLYASDAKEKMNITRVFFRTSINKYNIFISDLVLEEIEKISEPLRTQLRKILSRYKFTTLKTNENARILAEKYVKAGIIPEKYFNDALHIAIAVINEMDVILSWNLQHIVKLKTIEGVNNINKTLGFKSIMVHTPEVII